MRLLLSPKGSVNADGSIKQARLACRAWRWRSLQLALKASADSRVCASLQEFFKPKQVVYVAEKKWGDTERDKLYEARRARAGAALAGKPSHARWALATPR
jgi:hypothetical protein